MRIAMMQTFREPTGRDSTVEIPSAAKEPRSPKQEDRNLKFRCAQHGISDVDYLKMFEAQGGRCAICRQAFLDHDHPLRPRIDHDHRTMRVRGLLCGRCNSGIGFFQDDPERLKRAVEYLANGDRSQARTPHLAIDQEGSVMKTIGRT
jgi:hypothetical protein